MTNKYLEKIAEQVGDYDLTDEQHEAYKKARSKNWAGIKTGLAAVAGAPLLGPVGMAATGYMMHKHQQSRALKDIGVIPNKKKD
jgi:hypothetical protein